MNFAFNPASGLIIVEAEFGGPVGPTVLRLALDTGATSTLVSATLLTAAGYDLSTAPYRVQMTTGSGIVLASLLPVTRFSALGQVRANFPVIAHTLPPSANIDGLLGLDFFRGLGLTLDFRQGLISLT